MSEDSPRIRRLRLDNDKITTRFLGSTVVNVVEARGFPPESYIIEYNIKGLYADSNGRIHERNNHRLEISLSLGYPRRAPQCKMITPVFHPNFDDTSVCIGDFWAPSEGLDDLIVRIGRMICYQEYNIKSPLNGLAAKWADGNLKQLPVDNTEVAPQNNSNLNITNDKIVVNIIEESQDIPDLEIFFRDAIKSDDIRFAPKTLYPRLDFGSISVGLQQQKISIGRSIENTIMIPQDEISTNHAVILAENRQFTLNDLGSTNGTYVNDRLTTEAILNHNDKIRFGNIEAQFLLY